MADGQLGLPFPFSPTLTAVDFMVHPSNALAFEFLGATPSWPYGRLALWGAHGCGKSHLLHIWASEHGAEIVTGAELREPFWPEGPLAVDDIDLVPSEPALLHLLNAAAEAKRPVLLTASRPPARLAIRLPDLASRLRSVTVVEIAAPDDDFLATLLARLLSDRQLTVKADVQSWLLTRLPRAPAALREAVARLDQATLAAKSPVTRPLATEVLAEFLLPEPLPRTVKETSP